MSKFAVGIPSYNEADNIGRLVEQIDTAAKRNGIELVIINSDNSSPDGTAKVFSMTETHADKVSLTSSGTGKGRNIFNILDYIRSNADIEYCFFIDADITSFEDEWILKHYQQYEDGVDFVTPNYKRKYIEGNGTNHFAYPMTMAFMDGPAPRQPLAGDFGVSCRLVKYLLDQWHHESVSGYGVDIFMSLHALNMGGKSTEIQLDSKLHKPSFHKMIDIFVDQASAYYSIRPHLSFGNSSFKASIDSQGMLYSRPIAERELDKRLKVAREFPTKHSIEQTQAHKEIIRRGKLHTEQWADILVEHENMAKTLSPTQVALSLTPLYLVRVVTYLREFKDPKLATTEISKQAELIRHRIVSVYL